MGKNKEFEPVLSRFEAIKSLKTDGLWFFKEIDNDLIIIVIDNIENVLTLSLHGDSYGDLCDFITKLFNEDLSKNPDYTKFGIGTLIGEPISSAINDHLSKKEESSKFCATIKDMSHENLKNEN